MRAAAYASSSALVLALGHECLAEHLLALVHRAILVSTEGAVRGWRIGGSEGLRRLGGRERVRRLSGPLCGSALAAGEVEGGEDGGCDQE